MHLAMHHSGNEYQIHIQTRSTDYSFPNAERKSPRKKKWNKSCNPYTTRFRSMYIQPHFWGHLHTPGRSRYFTSHHEIVYLRFTCDALLIVIVLWNSVAPIKMCGKWSKENASVNLRFTSDVLLIVIVLWNSVAPIKMCGKWSNENASRTRLWALNDPRNISNNLALGQPWSSVLRASNWHHANCEFGLFFLRVYEEFLMNHLRAS